MAWVKKKKHRKLEILKKFKRWKFYYLSVMAGSTKNIHKWTPITRTNWKIIFPRMYFLRYKARSMTIKANWRIIMRRNGMGTLFSSKYADTPPSPCWVLKKKKKKKKNYIYIFFKKKKLYLIHLHQKRKIQIKQPRN